MRVLHVYKSFDPVRGGIENHIRALATAQAKTGEDVTVLAASHRGKPRQERIDGVTVVRAPSLGTLASMPLSPSLALQVAARAADVCHVHSPFPLGELANWILGRAGATVITHHSDIVRQRRALRLYGPLLRRILDASDAIVATSPPYVTTSPWLAPIRDRVSVVPLGVDLARFDGARRSPRGEPRVLFVGRLRYYKGVDVLLRAIARVPESTLDIVGDGPMAEPWRRLARDLELEARVRFHGEVTDEELLRFYREAQVLALPSSQRAEAFGLVLLEAMACELPIISTELGTGTSWVNRDGETGVVVPPGDDDALGRALHRLLTDRPLRERLGRAARSRVESDFTLSRMCCNVAAVYQGALEKRRAARARG